MVIKVTQVSKAFGQKKVLDAVNLTVEEGEIFGLLGPSGAGKTTLIRIITGQLAADEGEVCVHSGTGQRKTGMVMDDSGLYDRLTVSDNLKLFARIYRVPFSRIGEVLDKVEMRQAVRTPAGKLSKGMRQRLVLARSILNTPSLLFLDEPTSGLDPATSSSIHALLFELQKQGTTIFLTTHNMYEAAKLCGRVALLNEGRIAECGQPEALCRKYNSRNAIRILYKNKDGGIVTGGEDNRLLILENKAENAERIGRLFAEEAVSSIHSSEPNLETVFLELTGRGLSDDPLK